MHVHYACVLCVCVCVCLSVLGRGSVGMLVLAYFLMQKCLNGSLSTFKHFRFTTQFGTYLVTFFHDCLVLTEKSACVYWLCTANNMVRNEKVLQLSYNLFRKLEEIETRHSIQRWTPGDREYKEVLHALLLSKKEQLLLEMWKTGQRRAFLLNLKRKYAGMVKLQRTNTLGPQSSRKCQYSGTSK